MQKGTTHHCLTNKAITPTGVAPQLVEHVSNLSSPAETCKSRPPPTQKSGIETRWSRTCSPWETHDCLPHTQRHAHVYPTDIDPHIQETECTRLKSLTCRGRLGYSSYEAGQRHAAIVLFMAIVEAYTGFRTERLLNIENHPAVSKATTFSMEKDEIKSGRRRAWKTQKRIRGRENDRRYCRKSGR